MAPPRTSRWLDAVPQYLRAVFVVAVLVAASGCTPSGDGETMPRRKALYLDGFNEPLHAPKGYTGVWPIRDETGKMVREFTLKNGRVEGIARVWTGRCILIGEYREGLPWQGVFLVRDNPFSTPFFYSDISLYIEGQTTRSLRPETIRSPNRNELTAMTAGGQPVVVKVVREEHVTVDFP